MAEPSTAPVRRGPTSGVHRAITESKPPLLASEVLRDELAPLQPARNATRVWLIGIALALTALGVALRAGVGVPAVRLDAATLSFSASGALIAAALLPFPYALRGAVALLIGLVLAVLGLRGTGPLAGLSVDGGSMRAIARVVALTALPAALLFRSRYRAYRRARAVLAVAMMLALPFLVLEAMLAADSSASWIARGGAVTSIAWVAFALFGFSGQGTTGFASLWAVFLLLGLPLEIGLRQFTLGDLDSGYLTYPATAVGLTCAMTLASLGLYQLLATLLGPEARRQSLQGARVEPEEPDSSAPRARVATGQSAGMTPKPSDGSLPGTKRA